MAQFSKGPWKVVVGKTIQILVGFRDRIAVVYSTPHDATAMAAGPRLLGELKHMAAIVRMREGTLRASEKAALTRALNLIASIEGRR
jgi:hypothetical protein